MTRRDTSKRLEAERCCRRKRSAPGAIDAPALPKPCEHRPGHYSADEDATLAADERDDSSEADVRVLDRAERHHAVADQRRERAANPEQRGPFRFPLRTAGQECHYEPRGRKQAHVSHPRVHRETAEVLVTGAKESRKNERKHRDHPPSVAQGRIAGNAARAPPSARCCLQSRNW